MTPSVDPWRFFRSHGSKKVDNVKNVRPSSNAMNVVEGLGEEREEEQKRAALGPQSQKSVTTMTV